METNVDRHTTTEMPRYKCHKEVWALKISAIIRDSPGTTLITPEDDRYAPVSVSNEYVYKHCPHVGGYFVVYEDGYQSFSPADVFEAGYTMIG